MGQRISTNSSMILFIIHHFILPLWLTKLIFSLKILILLLALFVIHTGCNTHPPSGDQRSTQIVAAYCECTATLHALDQSAPPTDSSSAFTAHLEKMQAEYDRTFHCLSAALNEHGIVRTNEIGQIQQLIQQKCPELSKNKELMTELLCR